MKLRIGWLYPERMSTYGDRGNVICLQKRCLWRGIKVELINVEIKTKRKILTEADLIFMGGAQDRQQKLIANDFLKNKGPVLLRMIDRGIPGLFICGAFQIMGWFYKPYQGKKIPGLGLFDLRTEHSGNQKKRLTGNVVIQLSGHLDDLTGGEISENRIVGFENHGGRTFLGEKAQPLGKIVAGHGNNGEDKSEGVIYKNALGSYLHGPILPKNPHLADWLIQKALETKYQSKIDLKPLDDWLEWQAHKKAIEIAKKRRFW